MWSILRPLPRLLQEKLFNKLNKPSVGQGAQNHLGAGICHLPSPNDVLSNDASMDQNLLLATWVMRSILKLINRSFVKSEI